MLWRHRHIEIKKAKKKDKKMNSSAGHAFFSDLSAVPRRPPRLMYMYEKMIWPPSLKGDVTHETKKKVKKGGEV